MFRYLFVFSLIALTLYPAYMLIVVTIDSIFGEKLFITKLLFESGKALKNIILSDWLLALPYALGISAIMTVVARWFPERRLPTILSGVMLGMAIGAGLGMVTEPLVGLSLGLAMSVVSPMLCLRYRGL